MKFRRLIHNIRLIVVSSIGILLGIVVGGIYYINQSGANEHWRAVISAEMEKHGIVAEFDNLKFDPTKGLIARGVTVYQDESRDSVVAELEHLVIDVDKTKLMRGIVHVDQVSLSNAKVSVPLDSNDPTSPLIVVENLQGQIVLPDQKTVEVRELSGFIEGIQVTIKDTRVWSEHLSAPKQPKPLQDARVSRIKLIARILQEIHQWNWPTNSPPSLTLKLVGSIDNPDAARLDFQLAADELERNDVTLRNVDLQGGYSNKYLTVDHFSLEEGSGKISAQADFHPLSKRVRFVADSSLHIQSLARRMFEKNIITEATFTTPPKIRCRGEVQFTDDAPPHFSATGAGEVSDFTVLGSRFEKLATEFSIQGGDIFLTSLTAKHRKGELTGKFLMKGDMIRFKADSTLPIEAFHPFLEGSAIERTLARAEFHTDTKCVVSTEGTMRRSDLRHWQAQGKMRFENVSYRGVDLASISGNFDLSHLHSYFDDVEAVFDYASYDLRKRYGGPSTGKVNVASVKVEPAKGYVQIDDLRATAWPVPVVQMFASRTAKHIEDYRFTRPPIMRASGKFGLRAGAGLNNFKIHLNAPATTYYDFLGKPLNLQRLRARIHITPGKVAVNNLSFNTFQGPCSGHLSVNIARSPSSYSGAMKWTRLHLRDIGRLYQFKDAERGLLTGGLNFSGVGDRVSTLNGKGALSLEKGNLFSVPMLGPITPLLGITLGKKYSMREKAEDASCRITLRRGVIYTDDFIATTKSLKFTGEGSVNLNNKQIDLTVRMNARGLLGVFALPLRPFLGLFQFQGSGAVSKPQWRTTMFTNPRRGKKDPIFNQRSRPRAQVIEE